jgi:hypothetical protein
MRRVTMWRPVARSLLFVLSILLALPANAKWGLLGDLAPIGRLLKNVGRYVRQHPNDAAGHYTLGRLYSLAFARAGARVDVMTQDRQTHRPLTLPSFPGYQTILERPSQHNETGKTGPLESLAESVRHYGRATELAPNEPLYWLGLGWMLEQGAAYASKIDAPFLGSARRASPTRWQNESLRAFRNAHRLALANDLAQSSFGPSEDYSIGLESAEGILRILGARRRTQNEEAEFARVKRSVALLKHKPRAVTPIIFPLYAAAPLDALLARDRSVLFDLAGDGGGDRWPWVGPNTGILVWNPGKTGRITSGRQLFGSVTWWMFWKDGYQALAALDDDQNGWLEGAELDGLAVWCDRNWNGVSDPGEVQPLAQIGFTRVAVRPSGRKDGTLWNPAGMVRRDGTALPTYDWTPSALDHNSPPTVAQ